MSGLSGVLDSLAANGVPFALEALTKVSVVFLAASVLSWLLRKQSSALRHLVWTFAVSAVLLVPVAVAVAPSWRVALLPTVAAPVAVQKTKMTNAVRELTPPNRSRTTSRVESRSTITDQTRETQSQITTAQRTMPSLSMILFAVWLFGAVAVYAWIAAGLIAVALVARKARPVTDAGWLAALESARARLGVRRKTRLLEADTNTTPMTFGLLSSTVVLPSSAREWSSARQRVVLLHELAHVGRRDVLVQLIAQAACATYWFHPLAWYAARCLRIEREHACDDTVVTSGERPSEYATHLLAVARAYRATSALQPAALAMARPSQLEGRLLAVLATGVRRGRVTRQRVLLAGAIAVAVVLPLSAFTPVARAAANVVQQSATVILHPRQSEPLNRRWEWAFADADRQVKRGGYWVGYSITRQAHAGDAVFSGSGGSDLSELSGTPLQTQLFGTRPVQYNVRGRGPIVSRDVAIFFRFEPGATSVEAATEVRLNSLHVGMNLKRLPVYWLGQAIDGESIEWLEHQYNGVLPHDFRDEVIEAVGEHQTANLALPFLKRVLERETDSDLRAQAAEALGEQGSPEAERLLRNLARNDDSPDVRRESAEALGVIPTPSATETLLDLALNADDSDVRREAAEALGEQSTPEALVALEKVVFNATDLEVQREAAESLGDMADDMGFEVLRRVVRGHRSWEVRAEAAESLAEFDPAVALPLLESVIFNDADARVQEDAVEAVGDLGDSGRSLLRRVVREHTDEDVRAKARETLNEPRDRKPRFDGTRTPSPTPSASPTPSPTPSSSPSGDLNEDVASSELLPVDIDETKLISEELARRSPEADAILALRGNLNHVSKGASDFVRERSVWALSLVRSGRIVEPLIAALRSKDWRERAYAGWALAQVNDQRAIGPLLEAARDEHWRVRMHALFALGETDGKDMERTNALIAGLDDTAWQVRYEAAQYLGDVGGPDAMGALKRVVADSHLAVREIAQESLAKLRGR